jgi:hypothetical protein
MFAGEKVCEPLVDLNDDVPLRWEEFLPFGDRGSFFSSRNPWLQHARHLTAATMIVQPLWRFFRTRRVPLALSLGRQFNQSTP